MSAWRWDERPSPDQTSRVPIPVWRVPKGERVTVFRYHVWLLAAFRDLRTHFVRGLTHPCQRQNCEFCKQGVDGRWKGYTSALLFRYSAESKVGLWWPMVLEITENILELADRREQVGRSIELWRKGSRANGPLQWYPVEDERQPVGPPPIEPFPIQGIVENFYGMAGRDLRPPTQVRYPAYRGYHDGAGPRPVPPLPASPAAGKPEERPPTPEERAAFQRALRGAEAATGTNGDAHP